MVGGCFVVFAVAVQIARACDAGRWGKAVIVVCEGDRLEGT